MHLLLREGTVWFDAFLTGLYIICMILSIGETADERRWTPIGEVFAIGQTGCYERSGTAEGGSCG